MSETAAAKAPEENKAASGLSLNPKTIIGICILLALITVLAGVLTRVLPTGEYYTYPEQTYRLESGKIVCLSTDQGAYESSKKEISFDEYVAELNKCLADNKSEQVEVTASINEKELEKAADVSGQVISGTYHNIDYRMPIWKIVLSMVLVFGSENVSTGLAIIAFIVLIGGTFLILDERGILKYIMAVVIKKFSDRKYLLLAIIIFICMLLSSTAGILEESVTLVPICCAITLALGWDSCVGLTISLISIAFGFTAATFNPFNVMTVQKLADVPVFSGLWYRVLIFVGIYAILFGFTALYCKKIEKDPTKSVSYESDIELRKKFNLDEAMAVASDKSVQKGTRAFVCCLCGVFACIIIDFVFSCGGVVSMGGMAILFTVGGLLAGKLTGLKGKQLLNGFGRGVKTIAPAIPLIFFILAITYILNEGMIIHTILNWVYGIIGGMSPYAAILMLFAFIVLLEFFIGSGTAKAFLIMPIVAPLAQMIGISGNSVTVAFCLSDGFTNILYPTSGIMIIAIGLVNISYGKWLKYTWKLFLGELILSIAILLFAIKINYV